MVVQLKGTAARKDRFSAKGEWVCFNGYEDFGDPGQNWLRMARRMVQKAIRRLLSRFRWFPTDRILGHFEPGSECHIFEKSELQELNFRDFELSKDGLETSKSDSSGAST